MDLSKLSNNYKFAGIAGIVGFVGLILPWASISYAGLAGFSMSGFEIGGLWTWLFLLACLGAVALAYFSISGQSFFAQQKKMGLLIVGGVAAIAMLIHFVGSLSAISFLGIGFWICLLAAAAMAYFGFMEYQAN